MRKLIDLSILFLKRNMTTTGLLSLAFPIFMIAFVMIFSTGDTSSEAHTAVLLEDQGSLASEIVSGYDKYKDLHVAPNYDAAIKRLEDGTDTDLYIFASNFTSTIQEGQTPEIRHVKLNNTATGDHSFTMYLSYQISDKLTESHLHAAGLQTPAPDPNWSIYRPVETLSNFEITTIILISFSVLYGSAFMSADLVSQRKTKVLRRGLATPTSGTTVLGANLLGSWFLQYLTAIGAILIISLFQPISTRTLLISLIMFALLCFYSVCIQIFYLRIFKNPQLAMFIGMMVSMVLMFLAMLEDMKDLLTGVPEILFTAAYLSPMYWLIEAFTGQSLLLPILVLFLLGAAFFVAGSFKVRDFAD